MTDDGFEARKKAALDAVLNKLAQQREAKGIAYDAFDLSEQHNGVVGQFNEFSKKYKADPSIENYVSMRRESPGKLIEIATSWSLDWVFTNSETLERYGIDPQTVAGALDADPACISEVSLQLMERLIDRNTKTKDGETQLQSRGLAIRDSLVNYLIAMMLDALDWNDELYIPRDLMVLIKHQIGAEVSVEARAMEVHSNRDNAVWIAAQMRYHGEAGSIRQVAQIMNFNPSTVARWFTEEETFEEAVRLKLEILNSDLMADVRKRLDDLRK